MLDTPVSLLDRLCRQPDEPHWQRFVALFTPILSAWGHRLGVPAADTEDLLQDVFTTLLRKLPEFRYDPGSSFRAWLWTVFRHRTIAWRKKQSKRLPLTAAQLDELASPDDVDGAGEAEYRRVLLDRALQLVRTDFPGPTWQMFWRVAVDDVPGTEVARQFNVTPNAVYLARGRVLARLRQEMADLDT